MWWVTLVLAASAQVRFYQPGLVAPSTPQILVSPTALRPWTGAVIAEAGGVPGPVQAPGFA